MKISILIFSCEGINDLLIDSEGEQLESIKAGKRKLKISGTVSIGYRVEEPPSVGPGPQTDYLQNVGGTSPG
jgi:hypothetical protein